MHFSTFDATLNYKCSGMIITHLT